MSTGSPARRPQVCGDSVEPAEPIAQSHDMKPTTDQLWAAVRAALKARDMPAVVALLHPLAVSDPRGVELFMATVDLLSPSTPTGEAGE